MDGWNAPQWADFDASVRSDIDEYFNVEHEELESGVSGDLQYHSCPSTPNSKEVISESPYKTPKSESYRANRESPARTPMIVKQKLSTVPQIYIPEKACNDAVRLPVPQVGESLAASTDVSSSHNDSSDHGEKVSRSLDVTATADTENPQMEDNEEDESADQNCTLVASAENDDTPPNVPSSGSKEPPVELTAAKATPPPIDANRDKVQITDQLDKTVMVIVSPNKATEKTTAKVLEQQSNTDLSKRTNLNVKKYARCRPTVLTSHARRQSTSKYRRASNKYVSLAEAVSKFQNGTPERFRSSHNRDAKSSNAAGPLQKAKHATLKLTCATSPLLRCKYRVRALSAPNQEEREPSKMEQIRKNRAKPNTLKQSAQIPRREEKISKQTSIAEPLQKVNSRSASQCRTKGQAPEASTKIGGSVATEDNASSRRNAATGRSKAGFTGMKKMPSAVHAPSSYRRTTANSAETLRKANEPTTSHIATVSSRRTMLNPSKPSMRIEDKPTVTNAHPSLCKTLKNLPEPLKKVETKMRLGVESSLLDKTKDTSILCNTMLPESTRKHTPCKKTVPTVVSTEDGVSIKDVEILHFGIPVGNNYKKITETVPFSFHQPSNKESQTKKDKLKIREIEEKKKIKPFQARPVPSYVTKPSSNVAGNVTLCFQRRNEITLKKKKEMFDRMVEREKQARIFHAKPAPKFKPVFVRGASSENLRTHNPIDKGAKFSDELRQRGLSQGSILDNRENTAPNVPTTNQPKLKEPLVPQNRKLKKTTT